MADYSSLSLLSDWELHDSSIEQPDGRYLFSWFIIDINYNQIAAEQVYSQPRLDYSSANIKLF